ncbi:MAG: hypothetical protein JWM21_3208 [Acidobacteria bacterium]|nr:hypothetical protein [Acidobacteriota bacterium]
MKILVTGGSGYLGVHVRRFFAADDFSRRSNLNILSESDLERVAAYDAVIHLAGYLDKSPDSAELCFRTNADGTANILRHMRPNSVFIYASTKDVYGAHADNYQDVPEECSTAYCGQSPLEWSKLLGERYVDYFARRNNIRACIFRLSTVYARPSEDNDSGFVTHYVESVKRGWPIKLPLLGQPVRDILHVDDLSRACKAFMESSSEYGLYNLGGGRANSATLRGIIDTVGGLIQCQPVIDTESTMPAPVPLNYVSDLAKVRDELGWVPEIGIEQGLRSLV